MGEMRRGAYTNGLGYPGQSNKAGSPASSAFWQTNTLLSFRFHSFPFLHRSGEHLCYL